MSATFPCRSAGLRPSDAVSGDRLIFSAQLQRWTNEAESSSVAFVVLTGEAADALTRHEIARRLELGRRRGFGSVKVEARIGDTSWATSCFPQKGDTGWFMAVKKQVCLAESLGDGEDVEVALNLL